MEFALALRLQKNRSGAVFLPLEISRESHPAETKGTSTSAFGLKGRELSGNSSEGYMAKNVKFGTVLNSERV